MYTKIFVKDIRHEVYTKFLTCVITNPIFQEVLRLCLGSIFED